MPERKMILWTLISNPEVTIGQRWDGSSVFKFCPRFITTLERFIRLPVTVNVLSHTNCAEAKASFVILLCHLKSPSNLYEDLTELLPY